MKLNFRVQEEIAILELGGRVHLYEIQNLREQFEEMKDHKYKKVIVDLEDVEHVDSSGLGVLIAQASKYKEKKVPFIITGINKSIEHLFKLSSFSKIFNRMPTIQDAIKS